MAKALTKICGVLGGLALASSFIVGGIRYASYGCVFPQSSSVDIALTRFDSLNDPRGQEEELRESISIRRGDPVFVHYSFFDKEGIKETRRYINGILDQSNQHRKFDDGKYPSGIWGIQNGEKMSTSQLALHPGWNEIRYEQLNASGKVTTKTAQVNVLDDKD